LTQDAIPVNEALHHSYMRDKRIHMNQTPQMGEAKGLTLIKYPKRERQKKSKG